MQIQPFKLRTAISYGKIAFGKFGTTGSVVGKAIVEAARMCADKQLFDKTIQVIISEEFLTKLGVAPGREFKLIQEDYEPRGLARKFNVYGK